MRFLVGLVIFIVVLRFLSDPQGEAKNWGDAIHTFIEAVQGVK